MAFIMPIMRARGVLARVVVGVLGPAAAALGAMAIGAGFAQRRGKESHGGHELVHWNALQHPDVLEGLLRHDGLLSGRSATVSSEQTSDDRYQFHFASIPARNRSTETTAAVSCRPIPCAATAVKNGTAALNKGTGHLDCLAKFAMISRSF